MNLDEIDALYTLVQVGDNRRDPDDIILNEWGMLLRDCEHFHIAAEAVRQHRRDKPGVWLEPGHIIANYRTLSRRILERVTLPPPQTSPEDTDGYIAELRAIRSQALSDPAALTNATRPLEVTVNRFPQHALERGIDLTEVGRL